jgi:hypothetical protein
MAVAGARLTQTPEKKSVMALTPGVNNIIIMKTFVTKDF